MWKDVVMAHSEILSQNFLEGTEENPQRSRLDTHETSRSQMGNSNNSAVILGYTCQHICVSGGRNVGTIYIYEHKFP